MKYVEVYQFVKKEVQGMEFKRFVIVICAVVFVAVVSPTAWHLPELIEVLK